MGLMRLNLAPKKILVVDDIPEMRSTIKQMLQSLGATDIEMAKNGRDTIASLVRKAFDLVLCDYNLGDGKDGQQVLEEAKHRELIGYSTVFVMVTAENAMDTVMAVVEHNPDDYLTKPFAKELLARKIETAFKKKRELEEIELALHRRQPEKALALCDQKIADRPPNMGELLRIKGEILLRLSRHEEAEQLYEGVLASRAVPWAELGLGRARFLGSRPLEARDVLLELTRKKRDYVIAYDWLARAQEGIGALEDAQATLEAATELSPKAIQRQKALARIAMQNGDLKVAERAYRRTISIGKESIYKEAGDYTGLAKVLSRKQATNEALKVLANGRQEFNQQKVANLELSLAEGDVFRENGRGHESEDAYKRELELHDSISEELPPALRVESAKASFHLGDKERGSKMMRDTLMNYSDDDEVVALARKLYSEVGEEEEGKSVIADVKDELVKRNNRGVELVKQGKLEEAVQFFLDTVKGMPRNKTANLNAAQVMLMSLQKNGPNDRYSYQVRECLQRAREIDPADQMLARLSAIHAQLSRGGQG
jgi:CheY-like chemotaxis protein